MAEKETLAVGGGGQWLAETGDGARAAPPAGVHTPTQDAPLFTPLDATGNRDVQPFPRSPKLQRKAAAAAPQLSQEQLSRRLEELRAERAKTDAHIQSLKKRKADLTRSTEVMKQQARERYESMRRALAQDERAALDSLELDLRRTRTRLDQVLKSWTQHQDRVARGIEGTQRALASQSPGAEEGPPESVSPMKPDASEQEIRLDDQRFDSLLKSLSSISKLLRAQLQRKTLLLDSSPVVIDRHTCHSQIAVGPEGRAMSFCGSGRSAPEHPLQFDKVCCALGRAPVSAARSYWEVDVRCCGAWAVGVAYGSLERKGRDKGSKLGRNRNSWCVELRNGRLSAWHNDRHVACQGARAALPGRVGVWVNFDKGQLTFYDAGNMAVLQRFSAAVTPVFDRAHHQFTEPLYPAVRLLRPPDEQPWPNHVELCRPGAP